MKRKLLVKLIPTILIGFLLVGCSTQRRVNVPRSNMRRQMALQRHLRKLNLQNQKLQRVLREASVMNIETGEAIEQSEVDEFNSARLNQMLKQYKRVNLDTQLALDSFQQAIAYDREKNSKIDQMLNGFASECSEQDQKVDDIRDVLYGRPPQQQRVSDRFHLGIASQYLVGSYDSESSESDYQGGTGEAYFTYVTPYNATVGFKTMGIIANSAVENADSTMDILGYTDNIRYYTQQKVVSALLTLGFRISAVETFNILPEFVAGIGESEAVFCVDEECDTDRVYKSDISIVGFEIPFYHNLTSTFSWGFKFSAYRLSGSEIEMVIDGESQGSFEQEWSMVLTGAGLMIGAAW